MCLFMKLAGFIILVVQCESQAWVVDDEGCRTPDGGVGNCVLAKRCEPMTNFLTNATKPISSKVKEKLRTYLCSFKSGLIWVCCPEDPITIVDEVITPIPPTDNEVPPDVTHHKNMKLLPEECGLINSGDKIRNGVDATLNEFPWMALLSYKTAKGLDFRCGGTVINEKYILTAAHCIANLTNSLLLGVRVGEYNIATKKDCVANRDGSKTCIGPVQDVAIEEIIPHPKFQLRVIQNDIGLLRLSGINLNADNVKPICLPVNEDLANAEIGFATVSGWGLTGPNMGTTILQKVDQKIVSLEECSNVYKNESRSRITKRNLCAGGRDGKDSCKGDSGGPLQAAAFLNDAPRYIQQGIVSYGHTECGKQGYPAVYTRVSFYMDWILDTMRP